MTLDLAFALAALTAAGVSTSDAWVEIHDTIAEAIGAAGWGCDKIDAHADRLTGLVAE
jgi:hypothetical protein